MSFLVHHPILTFVVTIAVLWMSSRVGAALRARRADIVEEERGDYGVLLTAMLTLLGLIIGFSFSMASSRYDQRKNLEEEEANAIGTEYVRADLLPGPDAAKLRALLKDYLGQRILFYQNRDEHELQKINDRTAQLQTELWSAVRVPVETQPTPVIALAVSGMNDVLNSQGYTQAAWWNRIPIGAWGLMWAIAICCNTMIGFYIHPKDPKNIQFVMPVVIAVAFLLLADIDSPRRGIIKVYPQNLINLLDSLGPR